MLRYGNGARGCLLALYRASNVKYLFLVLQAAPSWLVGTSKFGVRYNSDFFFFFLDPQYLMSLSHSFRSLGINFQSLTVDSLDIDEVVRCDESIYISISKLL